MDAVMPRYPADALGRFARAVLVAGGMTERDSAVAADCLVAANLRGVDSHGVLRLGQYVRTLRAGGVNLRPAVRVARADRATAVVDADGGYGFVPAMLAVDTACALADTHGIGAVGVRRSHHLGMVLTFTLRAAERGFIGVATTNSVAVLGPPGGTEPMVGNNPISIAVPRAGRDAIALDMALSEAAWGKISLAATNGTPIPVGWARDKQGRPTTDAAAALAARLLVPIGGHKGFGLAFMLELLTGALTGSPAGPDADGHGVPDGGVGHLILAISPEAFLPADEFAARVERLVRQLHTTPRAEGVDELFVPGEQSWRTFRDRSLHGVPISIELEQELVALASDLGVSPLLPRDDEENA